MSLYYDRSGNPLTLEQWATSFQHDADDRRVAGDLIEGVWVSTVFLGLNHAYTDGPPLIFETMTFNQIDDTLTTDHDDDGGCWRYSTEAEALAGHAEVCDLVRAAAADRRAQR